MVAERAAEMRQAIEAVLDCECGNAASARADSSGRRRMMYRKADSGSVQKIRCKVPGRHPQRCRDACRAKIDVGIVDAAATHIDQNFAGLWMWRSHILAIDQLVEFTVAGQ
jgi:hypothetical protein